MITLAEKTAATIATGIIWLDLVVLSERRTSISEKIITSELSGITPSSEDKNLEDKYWEIEKNHFLNSLMGVLIFLLTNLTLYDSNAFLAVVILYFIFAASRVLYTLSGYFDSKFSQNIGNFISFLCIVGMLLTSVIMSIININKRIM